MQIALIGAGPRNLAILDQLIHQADSNEALTINLFDPYPIGGRVWNPFFKNNEKYLMNTAANQVTLFNDYDLSADDPLHQRPNLLSWAQVDALDYLEKHPEYPVAYREEVMATLSMTTNASRGLLGIYAAWYYDDLLSIKPHNISVNYHQISITDMTTSATSDSYYDLVTSEGDHFTADYVVLAPGHLDDVFDEQKKDFASFAKKEGLHYFPASHPAESKLEVLNEKDVVLVQGLGLSFFDDMSSLSVGKGGVFFSNPDNSLIYHASGKEPHLIIGSRSGLPPRAHGINQKGPSELYQPIFFTLEKLKGIAAKHKGHLPYKRFRSVLNTELTYKYILNQINLISSLSKETRTSLLEYIKVPKNWSSINSVYHLDINTKVDWKKEAEPADAYKNIIDFRDFFIQHLKDDNASAAFGNDRSPLTGAYDILRDMRGTVRTLYNEKYFSNDDYEKLTTEFKLFDVQLSVGPPLLRTRQLLALIEAGQVEVAGPNFTVNHDQDSFIGHDRFGQQYHGTAFIEARLPRIDFRIADSPLIQSLRDQGLIRCDDRLTTSKGKQLFLNTIKVDHSSYNVINRDDEVESHFFITGIPLEGQRWFTTVIPRPYVNTIAFEEAVTVVNHIFPK